MTEMPEELKKIRDILSNEYNEPLLSDSACFFEGFNACYIAMTKHMPHRHDYTCYEHCQDGEIKLICDRSKRVGMTEMPHINDDAILALDEHKTHIPKADVDELLKALEFAEKTYPASGSICLAPGLKTIREALTNYRSKHGGT